MLNYDYIFGDHFAKVSEQARLYYIKLMFYANCGFVANPISVLDSLGYDKSVLVELINNGDVLALQGRSEIFITSFFVHNKGFKFNSWMTTPYVQYWRGKLYIKRNGIATFKPQKEEIEEVHNDPSIETTTTNGDNNWENLLNEINDSKSA